MPSSARHSMSVRTERSSLSIRTPSQLKMTRSNCIRLGARSRLDRNDDDREIVNRTARQHAIAQALHRDLELCSSEFARDLSVADHVGEAIAAQEKAVARGQRLAQDAEFEPAGPNRPCDDMRLGMQGGSVGRQQSR